MEVAGGGRPDSLQEGGGNCCTLLPGGILDGDVGRKKKEMKGAIVHCHLLGNKKKRGGGGGGAELVLVDLTDQRKKVAIKTQRFQVAKKRK